MTHWSATLKHLMYSKDCFSSHFQSAAPSIQFLDCFSLFLVKANQKCLHIVKDAACGNDQKNTSWAQAVISS